jgi:hypothetical protein
VTERVPEPPPPRTTYEPVEADRELARRNMALGWALFGLALLIFGGTIGVAVIYLLLD